MTQVSGPSVDWGTLYLELEGGRASLGSILVQEGERRLDAMPSGNVQRAPRPMLSLAPSPLLPLGRWLGPEGMAVGVPLPRSWESLLIPISLVHFLLGICHHN